MNKKAKIKKAKSLGVKGDMLEAINELYEVVEKLESEIEELKNK